MLLPIVSRFCEAAVRPDNACSKPMLFSCCVRQLLLSVVGTGAAGAVTTSPYNMMTVVGAVPQADGSTQLMLGDGSQVAYSSVKQII